MLYNLNWLAKDSKFPPEEEEWRLIYYTWYTSIFDINAFATFGNYANRLIANFDAYIQLPLLLGYQRLSTIKVADMVIGAPPSITVNDDDERTNILSDVRDEVDLDSKLYQMIIDYSRYGVTVVRLFNDDTVEEDKGNFAVWNPKEWFPVLRNDGTKRIDKHVLAWKTNEGSELNPLWKLNVQIHPVKGDGYIEEVYTMDSSGVRVEDKIKHTEISLPGAPCLVQYVANLPSTTNIYGTSDYKIINELIFKATERLRQILHILDRHADPSMTGPASLLQKNEATCELEFKTSQFYAVSPGEEHPEYLTWNGELEAAYRALEILLNQIYVFSEMGEAMLGNTKGSGQAISGTAMRYKMISPLEKARRVANSFRLPLKKLISGLMYITEGTKMRYQDINITWKDSLPKDPRENAELTRLQTGAPGIIPLKHALMENYDMDTEDAEHYIEEIIKDQQTWKDIIGSISEQDEGPNPQRKGSVNTPSGTGTQNVKIIDEDAV